MAIITPKLDSVHEMSPRALGELKAWLEPWFLNQNKCCAAAEAAPLDPFYDVVASLAATRDLRGYWRLGDDALGPYLDTSGQSPPRPMERFNGAVDMTDVGGALPAGDDDGAVQFNGTGAAAGDYLEADDLGPSGRFNSDVGTIAGWVKPLASGSSFRGGIIELFQYTGSASVGWSLGVEWPSLHVFHWRGNESVPLYGPVLEANKWVFVVGAKDSVSTRIYLNGALVASGPPVSGATSSTLPPRIGTWFNLYPDEVFYGAVDEVSVWGDALTDEEIALLAASGGLATDTGLRQIINVVGAYTALPEDTVFANGTFTVTLPTAVGNSGSEIVVKNSGAGTITVAQDGTETIDGSTTDLTLAAADAVVLVSNGTGWYITSSYSYP